MRKKEHLTELRDRSFKRSFCIQKGCKFYGKEAVQGVCFSSDPMAEDSWARIKVAIKYGEASLREEKAISKNHKDYVQRLESSVSWMWTNQVSHLNEMIYSRRRISLLEHDVARLRAKIRRLQNVPNRGFR